MHRKSDKKHNTHHIHNTDTLHNTSQWLMKPTTFNNSRYTTNIPTDPCTVTTADIKANMRNIHTTLFKEDGTNIWPSTCGRYWKEKCPTSRHLVFSAIYQIQIAGVNCAARYAHWLSSNWLLSGPAILEILVFKRNFFNKVVVVI